VCSLWGAAPHLDEDWSVGELDRAGGGEAVTLVQRDVAGIRGVEVGGKSDVVDYLE
jgi:hypothetical protein